MVSGLIDSIDLTKVCGNYFSFTVFFSKQGQLLYSITNKKWKNKGTACKTKTISIYIKQARLMIDSVHNILIYKPP